MDLLSLKKALDYYKQEAPQLTELLTFHEGIFELQHQYLAQLQPLILFSKEEVLRTLNAGKYLCEENQGLINRTYFREIVTNLNKLLKARGQEITHLERLCSVLPDPLAPQLSELIAQISQPDKNLSHEEMSLLNFVLWRTLSVFYQKQAEILQGIDYQSHWSKSICPVCGNVPNISKLLKDTGKRVLACYLCWTEWSVHRLVCPYCGNSNQDKLEYFYADGNKAYRVDVCNNCNKYLKTIDENVLGRKVILEVEDIITYHLDTLAIKEGRQNPLFFL